MSSITASTIQNQSKPFRPTAGVHITTYRSVVNGRNTIPSSGHSQLPSNGAMNWFGRAIQRMISANLGNIPAKRTNRQPMCPTFPTLVALELAATLVGGFGPAPRGDAHHIPASRRQQHRRVGRRSSGRDRDRSSGGTTSQVVRLARHTFILGPTGPSRDDRCHRPGGDTCQTVPNTLVDALCRRADRLGSQHPASHRIPRPEPGPDPNMAPAHVDAACAGVDSWGKPSAACAFVTSGAGSGVGAPPRSSRADITVTVTSSGVATIDDRSAWPSPTDTRSTATTPAALSAE